MDIYIVITMLIVVFGLIILYYVLKAAVRNGTIEARAKIEQQINSELKKTIREAINTALESREKQTMYELKKAIYESVKAIGEGEREDNI